MASNAIIGAFITVVATAYPFIKEAGKDQVYVVKNLSFAIKNAEIMTLTSTRGIVSINLLPTGSINPFIV